MGAKRPTMGGSESRQQRFICHRSQELVMLSIQRWNKPLYRRVKRNDSCGLSSWNMGYDAAGHLLCQ
jgi:hypothetical protein